jgi:kynureninase
VSDHCPDWDRLRTEFPLLERCLYFNACSLGPLPRRGMAALHEYAEGWDRRGTPVWYDLWQPAVDRLRARVADLLNAPDGSIALAPSVSAALLAVSSALLARTDRRKVLVGRLDFPTVSYQYLSRPGVEVEFVESEDGVSIPPESFAERIDGDTALVATTHLFYTTGYLQDVRALVEPARRGGAVLLVDGYQTVGCVPIDVCELGCDVFIGGSLKWLSGGPGTAFVYVRPDLASRLEPVGAGWMGTKDFLSFRVEEVVYADGARRLENGTWPVPSHFAALAALDLVLEVGVGAIAERLRDFTDVIIERCDAAGLRVRTPRARAQRVGIVSIECARPEWVERRLLEDGVVVDARPGLVRLSPHWALSLEQVERGTDLVIARLREAGG